MALHHAAKGVEERLEGTAAFEDSEGALVQGIAQRAPLVTNGRLRRAHHHRGRRGIHATQDLQDARTGRLAGTITDRQANVDDGDVDADLANDLIALGEVAGAQAPDALRLQEPWQEVGEGVIAPAAVGKEQIQVRSASIMRRSRAIARAMKA